MTLLVLSAGAVISLGSARFQHWRDRVAARDDRTEARKQAMVDEQRRREHDAAWELLRAQAEIRAVLRHNSVDVRPPELFGLTEQIDIQAECISDDGLRDRIEYLGGIVWWCDDIGARVSKDPRDVAWLANNEVGFIAGCILRGTVRPEPEWYSSWAAAWDDAEAQNIREQEAALQAAGQEDSPERNPGP